jgi:cytochrome c-type biogenesis protein CcmH/NrfG
LWKSLSDSCKYLGASLAIALIKRKLRRRPHDWTLWLTLARLYEVGYQWSQAIDSLEHARQLSSNNEVITQELARIKEEAKQDSHHTRERGI